MIFFSDGRMIIYWGSHNGSSYWGSGFHILSRWFSWFSLCCILFPVHLAQGVGSDVHFLRDEIHQLEIQLEEREKELTLLKKEMGREKNTREEVLAIYILSNSFSSVHILLVLVGFSFLQTQKWSFFFIVIAVVINSTCCSRTRTKRNRVKAKHCICFPSWFYEPRKLRKKSGSWRERYEAAPALSGTTFSPFIPSSSLVTPSKHAFACSRLKFHPFYFSSFHCLRIKSLRRR